MESMLVYIVVYCYFWIEIFCSIVFYGVVKIDILGCKCLYWVVNVIDMVVLCFDVGLEFGVYFINDDNIDSIDLNYI